MVSETEARRDPDPALIALVDELMERLRGAELLLGRIQAHLLMPTPPDAGSDE